MSFGITMASNMGFGVVKEFLPDVVRALAKKHKKPPGTHIPSEQTAQACASAC